MTARRRRFAIGLAIAAAVVFDAAREPERQLLAAAYLKGVEAWQAHMRPLVANHACCRFVPSCSEYSAEAVRSRGIARGLWLTIARLARCGGDTKCGTPDAVPK